MSSRTDPTILEPLRAHTEVHPDKTLYAFLDRGGRITESYSYAAFFQRTTDVACHIARSHPLQPGERVLLLYPPGLEMICAFFACVRLGLIPVPVYPPSSHGFAAALYKMNFIAQDCGAAAVLTERSVHWSMKLHRARTHISTFSFKPDATSRLVWIVTDDAEPNTQSSPREAHSEILFLQYTSGSTRRPRGVMVTHGNVLDNCDHTIDPLPIGVSWLPQYHDMGLIGSYLFVALKGGTTYAFSPIDFMQRPALWLETIGRVRATISAAPNFAYGYCLRADKVRDEVLDSLDLTSLEVLMNGAEPVRADVFRGFLERFGRCGLKPSSFVSAYGLAEFTLAVSSRGRRIRSFDASRLAEGEARLANEVIPASESATLVSCGRPIGSTEVRIVDVAGPPREAALHRIGEIWLRGPSKARGYWNRPRLSEQVFEARIEGPNEDGAGWLRTGDLGFLLDGELFICGRTKDLIIIRGLNYFPQDIEALVEEDPAIRKGCVAAFAVEREGREQLVVVAELRRAKRHPDATCLNRNIHKRLGIVADSFVYIPARTIPKTSSGKIMRHRVRALWRDGALAVLGHVEPSRSLASAPGDPAAGDPIAGPAHDGSRSASQPGDASRSAGVVRATSHPPSPDGIARKYRLSGAERIMLGEAGLDSLAIAELAVDLERYFEARGAPDLAAAVDVRWLQKIPISELFALLRQLDTAAPRARLRFQQTFAALQREHRELERRMMRRDARLAFDPSVLSASSGETGTTGGGSRPIGRTGPTGGGNLVTGGTGFFGPFLLQSLFEQTDDDIYVVVRAQGADHGRERLREGLLSLGVAMDSPRLDEWEDRVIPVCGDLSRPRLGVSAERWDFLTHAVHTIYHNGARVNYLADYASMRDVNVGGTNEVVRLALTRRPKVLNHISSTFVFGWSTKPTLFEGDNNEDMELLDFGYSQSKWVSEQIVFDAMRHGLSARVFRPALITPSVSGGGYNFDIAIRLLAFMIRHGMTTTARNQVSFSPADLVANNVVAIANLPDTVGQTFHVTRDRYASMLDITEVLGRLLQRPFTPHSIDDFVPLVIQRCGKDDLLFPLLNFLVRSVDNITAMEFKRYGNDNYRRARDRSPFGRKDPTLDDVVLGIVRFLKRHALIGPAPHVTPSTRPYGGPRHARP